MALRSCLLGTLLILSVFSTQSLAARRLDEATAPLVDAEPDRHVYPKPPDPVPPVEATVLDDEPIKTDQHTAVDCTNQLPKMKENNKSRKTGVQGKAAVKPKDCNDDCGYCDDCGADDMGGGDDMGGDGGDAMAPDCGQMWNGGDGGDDDTGGGGDDTGGSGGDMGGGDGGGMGGGRGGAGSMGGGGGGGGGRT